MGIDEFVSDIVDFPEYVRSSDTAYGKEWVIADNEFYRGVKMCFNPSARFNALSLGETYFVHKGIVLVDFGRGCVFRAGESFRAPEGKSCGMQGFGDAELFRFSSGSADNCVDSVISEHHKGWGRELWIANGDYCGKKLVVLPGKKCSVHYHELKDETFFADNGVVYLRVFPDGFPGKAAGMVLGCNAKFHVPRGLPHQFVGVSECNVAGSNARVGAELFEFSTKHIESDSYRLAPGDSQKNGLN